MSPKDLNKEWREDPPQMPKDASLLLWRDQFGADLAVLADLAEAEDRRIPLYLEVTVNKRVANLVAKFVIYPARIAIFSSLSQLTELWLNPSTVVR